MKDLLKRYFGYDEFRPFQEEAVLSVLAGRDTFVLMPTGGGKSLCYQLPALGLPGITLVVSPLIALMKDQVDALKSCGIGAEFINSSLSPEERRHIEESIKSGGVKILYVAPERFALGPFRRFLSELEVSLIAVDEAHCISEWGHDFRPDYRNLSTLRQSFPGVPLVALTATATERVRGDIIEQLDLKDPQLIVSSFDRENLRLRVIEKRNALPKLLDLLEGYRGDSCIIYCFSRRETDELAEKLEYNGFDAVAYHAGLSPEERKRVQDLFTNDKANIIVATVAFGMGIDKPDVRLVVHYTYPKTIEGYYQEIGRAGRDGLPSECVMFYTQADTRKHSFFIDQIEDQRLRERADRKLGEMMDFAELTTCRKKFLLRYFGEEMEREECLGCDICLEEKSLFDGTVIAQKILSAVARSGQRFGRAYITDLLSGRSNQKVRSNGHDRLSVFGIARDFTPAALGNLVNQLVSRDLLKKSAGRYPTLAITREGADFLRSDARLELKRPRSLPETRKILAGELAYDPEIFEELRALRRRLADDAGVPPFVIFGDVSLREMAYYLPRDREAFLGISGVGQKKLEDFGPLFLETISAAAEKRGLSSVLIPHKTNRR